MIIMYIVVGMMVVLALILLSGRGSWMIAGYNTMSKEQQNRYDKKKLTRATGTMLLVIALSVLGLAVNFMNIIIFLVIVFSSVIVLIIYTNKYCFVADTKDSEEPYFTSEFEKSSGKNIAVIITIVLTVLVAFAVGILLYSGSRPPIYSVSETTFDISSMYGKSIELEEIQSVQLKEDLPEIISKINGFNGVGTILKGRFSSDIGDVTLFIDSSKPPFIYIQTETEMIILNDQSGSKTEALYEELNELW